jgi:mono/diheme cytochrome c family protein
MKLVTIILLSLVIVACTDSELSDMHRLSNGAKVYKLNCANCHQENGEGLANLMPPLQNSDWFKPNLKELPCLIKHGQKTPMQINGITYKQAMPALKHLSAQEIKDVSVYVAQKFAGLSWEQADSLFSQVPNSCN